MPPSLMVPAGAFGLFGLGFLVFSVRALKARKVRKTVGRGFFALLWLSLAALFATLSVASRGYQALTQEEVVARITTRQVAPQRFEATVELPGEAESRIYTLTGDELYVDAHILKWKPLINVLGLHTTYELDRIGGRYIDLEEEKTGERSLYSLASEKTLGLDLFDLRRKTPLLSFLVDAEYGSGTFIGTEDRGRYEVRVTTSGLIVRSMSPTG